MSGRRQTRIRPSHEGAPLSPGPHELEAALLWAPRARAPVPLLVMQHGAGGSASGALGLVQEAAERASVAVLAPRSAGASWDRVRGAWGEDVRALAWLSERLFVDASRVALGGFSDGASYALLLGLGSGDLLSTIVAFAPGFVAPGARQGRPAIFVSHGTGDPVLPIAVCRRRVVPELERNPRRHRVTALELTIGHGVAREALRRIAGRAQESARP